MWNSLFSQEIRNDFTVMSTLLTPLISAVDLKIILKLLIDFHYTSHVVTPIAVVGRWPNCYEVFVLEPYRVALLGQLMGSGYELEAIMSVELVYNFVAEQPTCASAAVRPCIDLLWIWPHKISERPFGGYFYFSVQLSNLVKRMNIGRETTMYTENLIFPLDLNLPSIIAPSGR